MLVMFCFVKAVLNQVSLQSMSNTTNSTVTNTDTKVVLSPQCSNISVYQRTDCLPQGGTTEQACTTAGCCWDPVGVSNSPSCFYPNKYKGYFVQSHKPIPGGTSYTLVRNTTSGWPRDVSTLQLDVTYEGLTRLHLKVICSI